jgi:hypothetical protein
MDRIGAIGDAQASSQSPPRELIKELSSELKKQTIPSCKVVVVGATTGTMELDAIVDDALHLRQKLFNYRHVTKIVAHRITVRGTAIFIDAIMSRET